MSERTPSVYRVWGGLRWLGAVGIAFSAYVLLYQAGVVKLRLFAGADGFDLAAPETWLVLVFLGGAGLLLVWVSYGWVQVSDDRITCHYPGRCRTIRWCDVRTRRVYPRNGDLVLRSRHVCMHLDWRFRGLPSLKRDVEEHLAAACPDLIERSTRRRAWYAPWGVDEGKRE